MMKLSEKEWKLKKLTDDFRPVRGRESNMAMLELGDIPLISAKNGSNGVKGFVNTPKKLVDGGCITLNNDGDGGAGLAYYQSTEMALDTHVTALIPRTDMKPDTMLFASECISKLHGFFWTKIPFCTVLVNLSLEPLSHAVLRNSNLDI